MTRGAMEILMGKVCKWLAAAIMFWFAAIPTMAQDGPRMEIFAGYTAVRANAPPGGCGCFWMNGGSGSFAYDFTKNLGMAADVTVVNSGNVDASGKELTLTSYAFGPRYTWRNHTPVEPFGEVLFGGAHASGLDYEGGNNGFALQAGGGADLRVAKHLAVRLVEADYYFTELQNGVNSRQNNTRLSFGIVFRFGGE